MRVKTLNAKGAALTVLGGVVSYAAFSFLAAAVCWFEIVEVGKIDILYFAIGMLGVFFTAVMAKCFLKAKRYCAALIALGMFFAIAFLCCGREAAAAHVWIYPGGAAGALGYMAMGAGKSKRAGQRKKKRRKK